MAEQTGRKDHERPFKDLVDALNEGTLPGAAVSADLFRALLDAQRLFLQQYQTVLKEQPADDALMQHHRAAIKSLLSCWLEMGESVRTHLDGVLSAQTKFVAEYVQVLDKLLNVPDKRKP